MLPIWKEFSKHNVEEWNLVILGNGPERNYIEKYINKEKLENIRIDVPTSDIEKYYEESSILVMTSIFEGFGLVLTEAMSRGCIPIVFDSFKSVHDIIDNGSNGILVPSFEIKKYVEELNRLTKCKNVLKSMSEVAQESIRKFEIEDIGRKWIKMLEKLI